MSTTETERYFPKEIWYIIKSYEFQMKYPPHIQRDAIENLRFHISMPFILGLHKDKEYPAQIKFIRKNSPILWDMFTSDFISKLIEKYIHKNIILHMTRYSSEY